MALLKDDGGVGEIIFVDSTNGSEKGTLPEEVRKALNGVGTLPGAVISDAKGAKVFGTFGHPELKSKDFSRIFRDAKKALKADIAVNNPKAGATKDKQPSKQAPTSKTNPGKEISNAPMEEWTNPEGRKLQAKLLKVNVDTFTFLNSAGKTIELTRAQLDKASQEKVDAHAAR